MEEAHDVPIVDYLMLDAEEPYLSAWEAVGSGSLYLDRRNADARCGGTRFVRRPLARRGTVHTYTVVYRAAPGVDVPYVSLVVDLDGGGCVKGNLVGVEPAPEKVSVGLRVKLVTYVAGVDCSGTRAIGFAFTPLGDDE